MEPPRCARLLTEHPGLGALVRNGSRLSFATPVAEPMHILYRFTGRSRHQGAPIDRCAESVAAALRRLQGTAQAAVTNLTVLAPDDTRDRATALFARVPVGRVDVRPSPCGNEPSYHNMLLHVRPGDAVITFLLEEDYLVRSDVFLRTAELFKAYAPCVAVPYDYPDRYTLRDATSRRAYARNVVLRAPHLHWRTVTSTTVTLAVRGVPATRLPTPRDDYGRSQALARKYGIFAPIPSLASHEHGDGEGAALVRAFADGGAGA